MTPRARWMMFVFVMALAGGFLYLHTLAGRMDLQGTQHAEEHARTELSAAALQATGGPMQAVTLYFPSDDESALVVETRQIGWAASDPDRIRQVLLALVEGSREGRARPLPPGTEVRGVFLTRQGTAYLDFSGSVLALFPPGIESETLTIYSIANSIAANIPSVKRIRILVQGQEVDTLNGHADLTGEIVPTVAPGAPAAAGARPGTPVAAGLPRVGVPAP